MVGRLFCVLGVHDALSFLPDAAVKQFFAYGVRSNDKDESHDGIEQPHRSREREVHLTDANTIDKGLNHVGNFVDDRVIEYENLLKACLVYTSSPAPNAD